MIANIVKTYAKNTYISSNYAIDIWIRYIGIENTYIRSISAISVFIKIVKPKILAKLRITLIGVKIKTCYFWLFMRLIFTSIEKISYWDIKTLRVQKIAIVLVLNMVIYKYKNCFCFTLKVACW